MYTQATVDQALALSRVGLHDREVAQVAGIPLRTVRNWRTGKRRAPGRKRTSSCPRCDGARLDEPAYAYLLGLYLGDGCLTHGPREVFALCIACCDAWPGLIATAKRAMQAVMPASGT